MMNIYSATYTNDKSSPPLTRKRGLLAPADATVEALKAVAAPWARGDWALTELGYFDSQGAYTQIWSA